MIYNHLSKNKVTMVTLLLLSLMTTMPSLMAAQSGDGKRTVPRYKGGPSNPDPQVKEKKSNSHITGWDTSDIVAGLTLTAIIAVYIYFLYKVHQKAPQTNQSQKRIDKLMDESVSTTEKILTQQDKTIKKQHLFVRIYNNLSKKKVLMVTLLLLSLITGGSSLMAAQNAQRQAPPQHNNGFFSSIQFSKKFGGLFTSIHKLFAAEQKENKVPPQNRQLVVYNPSNQYYFQPRQAENNNSEKLITKSDILWMVGGLAVMVSGYYICLKQINKLGEDDNKLEEVFDKYLSTTEKILKGQDEVLRQEDYWRLKRSLALIIFILGILLLGIFLGRRKDN